MGGKERRENKDEYSLPPVYRWVSQHTRTRTPLTDVLRGMNTLLNGVGYLLPYSTTVKRVEERPTSGDAPAVADIGKA